MTSTRQVQVDGDESRGEWSFVARDLQLAALRSVFEDVLAGHSPRCPDFRRGRGWEVYPG